MTRSSELDDFDQALFGQTVGFVDRRLGEVAQWFDADGVFASQRPAQPVFAGLLAFVRVGLHAFPDPVLYLNSRFDGELPTPLLALERCTLAENRASVERRPATIDDVLAGLGFLPMDV